MSLRLITGLLVLSLLSTPALSSAAVIQIAPRPASHCHEELEKVAETLKPDDELILHGGTYSQFCRRAITVNGTAAAPIIIRAALGPSRSMPVASGGARDAEARKGLSEGIDPSGLIRSSLPKRFVSVCALAPLAFSPTRCRVSHRGRSGLPRRCGWWRR